MGFSGNMVVAQSGGPTAAINSSLLGVIKAALDSGINIYGAENGINGIRKKELILLNPIFSSEENCRLLKNTPASFLGSCRYQLPNTDEKNTIYEQIFENLAEFNIKYLVYIGGNDSMDTVAKLSHYAERHKKDLIVVGVPKTIDNDLVGTDHCPGFGSAAKYVAASVKEIARDSAVYVEKSITIVEIMGRNAGWLTAASALARSQTSAAPHLIYLPEHNISREKIIADVEAANKRNLVIAISEGIKDEKGRYYCESEAEAHDVFGHVRLAGAARVVSEILKNHFMLKTRGIELNIPQRCAGHFVSLADIDEAEKIGYAGARAALNGKNGTAMGFFRKGQYEIEIVENKASDVANFEKKMPDEFISPDLNDVTDTYIEYARPLIMGEPELIFENGLPKHIALHNFK